MLAFNNLNKVDKKWSKYLLDTLDLSLRKQFNNKNNCIDTHKINTNRLINNDIINLKNNLPNSNTYFIIVYGFSCFIAGYFFANKTC